MSNTTNKTTTKSAPKTSAKGATKTAATAKAEPVVTEAPAIEEVVATEPEVKQTYKVRKTLDPRTVVSVRNGFTGTLIYKSPKTGEKFIWDDFGDELDMELSDLKAAKGSQKKFFTYNWFMIDDPEILDYLGVSQYYRNAIDLDTFDDLFSLPEAQMRKKLAALSDGQKKTARFRAKRLIEDGVIDSLKTITALEETLGVELVER